MPVPTLAPVGKLLRTNAAAYRDLVHEKLFTSQLEARQVFPLSTKRAHVELAPALAWVLEQARSDGSIPPAALARVRRLGLAHRRHGFPPEVYGAFADMLTESLRELNYRASPPLATKLIDGAETAMRRICDAMWASSATADRGGEPPAHVATVVETRRISARTTVLRLEAGPGLDYEPGQALQVTAPYLPGLWRLLNPANLPDSAGSLEFHVRADPDDPDGASGLLAAARVGDYWTVGAPLGALSLPDAGTLIILAYGTGLAAAESVIFSLIWQEPRPRVRLITVAEYPGEVYDLERLLRLASHTHWLRVTPVTEHSDDPWWLPRPGVPRITDARTDDPLAVARAVLASGPELEPGAEVAVLITGPDDRVAPAAADLNDAGVAPNRIQTVSFSAADRWAPTAAEEGRESEDA